MDNIEIKNRIRFHVKGIDDQIEQGMKEEYTLFEGLKKHFHELKFILTRLDLLDRDNGENHSREIE